MKHVHAPLAKLAILLALAACGDPGTPTEPIVLDADGNEFVRIRDLGESALSGSWSSTGGSCDSPDFVIARDGQTGSMGLAVRADFNGWDRTGRIDPGGSEMQFIDPRRDLPVRLDDGGLHVGAPSDGLAVLGSRNIFEEGVLFRKCAA